MMEQPFYNTIEASILNLKVGGGIHVVKLMGFSKPPIYANDNFFCEMFLPSNT